MLLNIVSFYLALLPMFVDEASKERHVLFY